MSTSLAGQRLGIKEGDDAIRRVSFMDDDLGDLNLEQKTPKPPKALHGKIRRAGLCHPCDRNNSSPMSSGCTLILLVGAAGFEPTTPSPPDKRRFQISVAHDHADIARLFRSNSPSGRVTGQHMSRNAYADDIFDFVGDCNNSRTIGELNRAFHRLVIDSWGFDNWMCIRISQRPTAIVHPLNKVFGEARADWINRYKEARHIQVDAAAHEIVASGKPFWWSDFLTERKLEKKALLVFREAAEFRMSEGLAIPIRFPDGSVWSCCLTGERPEKTQDVKEAAEIVAQFYAGRGGHLRDEISVRKPELACRLTDRQRQIVEFLRYGKTQEEIAKILGLSSSTVYNLLAEARNRLGVATTTELVAEALLSGEIPGLEH